MRHIEYPVAGKRPRKEWMRRARAVSRRLQGAPDKAARDNIIDANSQLWGELRCWLAGFSYNKCWFSEARNTCFHWQVEHFRPKKEAQDPKRDGYWWYAFDYRNFRLCGSVTNAKKGSYFPLHPKSKVASNEDECDDEIPLLIDPTSEADVMLLTFDDAGRAVPAVDVHHAEWDHKRAEESIKRYKLNDHVPLVQARKQVWNDCENDLRELEALMVQQQASPSAFRRAQINHVAKRLKDRTRPSSEFSSVAVAFLTKNPRRWAQQLIA